jgi:hypothetical protein
MTCEKHEWKIVDEWSYDSFIFGGIVKRVHVAKKECKVCKEVKEEEMYWEMLYDERN